MNLSSFEDIKVLMDNFDPAALLPDLATVVGKVEFFTRLAMLIGPIVLLILGLLYFFIAPKEANHHFGYRCYFGMGSVEAWRFSQRLGGMVWAGLGLALTVIMTIVSLTFHGKPVMDIVSSGLTCVVWEVILVGIATLAVNILVARRYDRNGEPREK